MSSWSSGRVPPHQLLSVRTTLSTHALTDSNCRYLRAYMWFAPFCNDSDQRRANLLEHSKGLSHTPTPSWYVAKNSFEIRSLSQNNEKKIHTHERKSASAAFFSVNNIILSFQILHTKGPVQLFQHEKAALLICCSCLAMNATRG